MSPAPPAAAQPPAGDRLRDDPYDLAALAERMLASAAAGESTAAQSDLDLLRRLRGALRSAALLERIVAADGPGLARRGPCFFVGSAVPSEKFARDLTEAVDAAARFLRERPPVVLVNPSHHPRGLHVTDREFAGFAVVSISAQSPRFPDRLRGTLFHEAAHGCLRSGSRLLDEGWALHFTERNAGGEAIRPLRDAEAAVPSVRALLSATGAEGLLFEEAGAQTHQFDSIRRRGAELVRALIDKGGADGLKALFARIERDARGERVVALVEQALGAPLETLDCAAAPGSQPAVSPADVPRLVVAAWTGLDRAALGRLAAELESGPSRPAEVLDALIGVRVAEAGIALNRGEPVAKDLFPSLDALLAEAESRGLEPGRLFTLRGHRAMLATRAFRSNVVKAAMASQQALHWYNKALRLRPNDPDLLVHFGALECHIPEKYGGGRARGLDYIRRAVGDPVWGGYAARFLEQPSAAVARPDAPPPPGSGAPAFAVRAASLRLRLSPGFELAISEFLVRPGERVAIVGPNGSGKSTLIEVLLGLRTQDAGTVALQGADGGQVRRRPELRRGIGALLQHVQFPGRIRVRELAHLHLAVYGRQDAGARSALGLEELESREYGALSRGQRQRVQLFLALAHQPGLVVLDEPSLGLDEWFSRSLRGYWTGPGMAGRTVLIVSHMPADLAAADRVVCLNGGRIVDEGPLSELLRRHLAAYHGRILQPIPEAARREIEGLGGLARSLPEANDRLSLYGDETFCRNFREFLGRWGVSGFSLEPTRAEDFLALLCHSPA